MRIWLQELSQLRTFRQILCLLTNYYTKFTFLYKAINMNGLKLKAESDTRSRASPWNTTRRLPKYEVEQNNVGHKTVGTRPWMTFPRTLRIPICPEMRAS